MSIWYNGLVNICLGDDNNKTQKKLAKFKNAREFQNVFARLVNDAMQRYSFDGLPDTVSERVLKEALLWRACAVFFEKEGNLICLPGGATQDFNVYGDTKYAYVWGRNGFNEKVELYIPGSDESNFLKGTLNTVGSGKYKGVYVRENRIVFPFINYCIEYAEAIADTMRTLDVVRANAKQPFVCVAEESIISSVKKFFEQRNDNQEYIVSSGVFPADKIKLLPFETNTSSLKDATDLIEWYYNKFYELCGVNSNANPDKKAEITSLEITANNGLTEIQSDKVTDVLQEHLDTVNKIFGTSITVKAKENPAMVKSDITDNNDNKEDEDNE